MTPDELLRLPVGDETLADILCKKLESLWRAGDLYSQHESSFSDQQWKVYAAMVVGGLITGKVDEIGYCEDPDTDTADDLICAAIRHAFGFNHEVPPTPRKEILPW